MQAGKKTAFFTRDKTDSYDEQTILQSILFFLPFENSSRWKVAFMKNAKVDKHNQNKECLHNSH